MNGLLDQIRSSLLEPWLLGPASLGARRFFFWTQKRIIYCRDMFVCCSQEKLYSWGWFCWVFECVFLFSMFSLVSVGFLKKLERFLVVCGVIWCCLLLVE